MNSRVTITIFSILTLTAVFAADVTTNTYLKNQLVDHIVTQYGSQETVVAKQTSQIFEAEIKSMEAVLYTVANLTEIQTGTPDQCNQKINEIYPNIKDQVGNIGRMDADGIFYCSINKKIFGLKGASLGTSLIDIMNDPEHKPVISRLVLPPGVNSYAIAVYVPVFTSNHTFKGTVGGELYLSKLQQEYLSKVDILDNKGYIALYDDNGDILYHQFPGIIGKNRFSEEVQRIVGYNESLNQVFRSAALGTHGVSRFLFNGEPRIAAFYPATLSSTRHWVVSVSVPVSTIQKNVLDTGIQKWFLVLYTLNILLLAIPFLILFWFLDHKIFVPLQKFADSAQRIGEGDLDTQIGFNRNNELGKLANAINLMADKLKKSYSALEDKVTDRTKQLEAARDYLANTVSERTQQLKELEKVKERIESEKIRSEAVMESMGEGLIVIDSHGIVTGLNRVAETMVGVTQKIAFGKPIDKILTLQDEHGKPISQGRNDLTLQSLQEPHRINSLDCWIERPGTYERSEVSVITSPIVVHGKIIGVIALLRDISKERQVDRAKTEFVSLASHQLRTPLSAINWYTEMLLAEDAGKITAEQRLFLDQVYSSSQRMVELVNSLLNVSRLELGTFSIDPVESDVVEIAQTILTELTPQITTRKQKIVTEYATNLPKIVLDPKLLRVVLQNILTNSVKYTQEGGKIQLGITNESIDEHLKVPHLLITITDNGYGIPKSQQSQIFSKLFRADNVTDKDTEGTGLGLYITRSVIEQTGGFISFVSNEGKGTTFYIAIPLSGMHAREGNKGLT